MFKIKELSLNKEILLANGVDFLGDVSFLSYGGLFVKQLGENFECFYVEVNEDEDILNFYEGLFDKDDLGIENFVGDLDEVERYADIDVANANYIDIINSIISYYGAYNFFTKVNINSEVDIMNILLMQSFIVVQEDTYYADICINHPDGHKELLKGVVGYSKKDILEEIAEEYDISVSLLEILKDKVEIASLTATGISYINEYHINEFEDVFKHDGSNEIGLAYTEIEDDEGNINTVQVTINFGEIIELITSKNSKIIEIIQYNSISELEEILLKDMTFDGLISIAYEDEDSFTLVS